MLSSEVRFIWEEAGMMHAIDWESLFAPYDQPTYNQVRAALRQDDVVVDIGAGDLRLAHQLAGHVRHVHAIENQAQLIAHGLAAYSLGKLPNLSIYHADARLTAFAELRPRITVGVLLMRHCTHFQVYAERLREAGVQRLITNARWRMSVEVIDLSPQRRALPSTDALAIGWYACWCGRAGFKTGPLQLLTAKSVEHIHEVERCPGCQASAPRIGTAQPPAQNMEFV